MAADHIPYTSLITTRLLRQVDLITSLITNWLLVDLITSLITNRLLRLVDLITSLITNRLLRQVDLITSLITNWLLRQVDGQKVWVVKDVKNEPMCGGEGRQRDESPEVLSRSHQAPYRASHGQPMGSVALPGTARPIPAPSLRDARYGALQKADDARDGAQRRRQTVSRLGTSPRMRNLIR